MGYRIEYGATMKKIITSNTHKLCTKKMMLLFIPLSLILAVTLLWGRVEVVRDFIIPGNSAVTEAAVSNLVNDLRAGETFGNAITAFCRVIIDNANIPA